MKRKGICTILSSLAIVIIGILLLIYSIGINVKPHTPMAYTERYQISDLGTLIGLMLMAIGFYTTLRDLKQFAVLRRMDDDEDVYARWRYEPSELDSIRTKALKVSVWHHDVMSTNPFVPYAYMKTLCFSIGASLFVSFVAPQNIIVQILIWPVIISGSLACVSWLAKKRHIWAIRNDPGEVFVARGGVWFMGQLIELNSEQWLDSASVIAEEDGYMFVLHKSAIYRARHFLTTRHFPRKLVRTEYSIPIPEEWVEEAREAARRLNDNPY